MRKILFYFLLFIFILSLMIFIKNTDHAVFGVNNILKKESVSVLNFGDVMFDRGVRNIIENRKRDPFEHIKKNINLINDYDISIVNLEGPIVVLDRGKCQQKAYNFQFATDTTDRLKSVGINMVNIANNHTFDCYVEGFESTKKNLVNSQIDYIGDSDVQKSFTTKNINGLKVAFVGIDRMVSSTPIKKYYDLIKKLKLENDFVVVHIHWGIEYSLQESAQQENLAHGLIDSGADVIFGHHPHVIEPLRIYKNKAIFYSLGNFVFDQVGEKENTGLGVGVNISRDGFSFKLFPYKIKIFAPDFMTEKDSLDFCNIFLKEVEHDGCTFLLTN